MGPMILEASPGMKTLHPLVLNSAQYIPLLEEEGDDEKEDNADAPAEEEQDADDKEEEDNLPEDDLPRIGADNSFRGGDLFSLTSIASPHPELRHSIISSLFVHPLHQSLALLSSLPQVNLGWIKQKKL